MSSQFKYRMIANGNSNKNDNNNGLPLTNMTDFPRKSKNARKMMALNILLYEVRMQTSIRIYQSEAAKLQN